MKSLPTSARAGSGRGVLYLFLIAIGLLVFGGQQLYTWYRNRELTSMSYADYLQKKPDADWVELKGVTLDIPSCAAEKKYEKIQSLYIPIMPERGDHSPAQIVLHTGDAKYISLVNEMNAVPDAQAAAFLLKNADRIWPKTDVKGLMEFGVEANSKHRDQLQKLSNLKLAPNFAVLKDGAAPNPGLGGGLFGGGLLLGFALLKRRNA